MKKWLISSWGRKILQDAGTTLPSVQFCSVHLLSRVRLFVTPWTAAHQASLSITNSRSSLKLMSIKSVMPSSHLILRRPLLLLPPVPPSIGSFPMSQLCAWGVLFRRQVHLRHSLISAYKWCQMVFIFLFLTYFTSCDNFQCHHVAPDGIVSFFL